MRQRPALTQLLAGEAGCRGEAPGGVRTRKSTQTPGARCFLEGVSRGWGRGCRRVVRGWWWQGHSVPSSRRTQVVTHPVSRLGDENRTSAGQVARSCGPGRCRSHTRTQAQEEARPPAPQRPQLKSPCKGKGRSERSGDTGKAHTESQPPSPRQQRGCEPPVVLRLKDTW